MNQSKISKYLLILTTFVSILSYSGYAVHIESPTINSEWVINENADPSKSELTADFKFIVCQKPKLTFNSNNSFTYLLIQHNNFYNTNYKALKYIRLRIKKNIYIINSIVKIFSNSNMAYAIFIG